MILFIYQIDGYLSEHEHIINQGDRNKIEEYLNNHGHNDDTLKLHIHENSDGKGHYHLENK